MTRILPARMPQVSPKRDIAAGFAEARRVSAGAAGRRWVVLIAPDGSLVRVPVPTAAEADPGLLRSSVETLSPEGEPTTGLTITAICCTAGIQARARSFFQILELVPNLSYLVGIAALGNTVVGFEGQPGDMAVACADADVLIVDDGMVPFLQPDWAAVALEKLRQPLIIQFGRDGRLSRLTRLVGVEQPGPEQPG
jgi:hypothetical protein